MRSQSSLWNAFLAKLGFSRKKNQSRAMRSAYRRLCFEQCEDRRMLAVLTVNSSLDNTIGGDGLLTLREAVDAANQDAIPDIINFDASILGDTSTITLTNGQLEITEGLTIIGPGKGLGDTAVFDLTISGNNSSRIFDVDSTSFEMSGLKLTDGEEFQGGAIYMVAA